MMTAAWQRGYDLAHLKEITALYKASDAGYVLGPHTRYSELAAAEHLEQGRLVYEPEAGYSYVYRVARTSQATTDFAGRVCGRVEAGDHVVQRVAYNGDAGYRELRSALVLRFANVGTALHLEGWQEEPYMRDLADSLGLGLTATRIRSSSELLSHWSDAEPSDTTAEHDLWTLRNLPVPQLPLEALVEAIEGIEYADHYSSYNKRGSWGALSLIGYDTDPHYIADPREVKDATPEQLARARDNRAMATWLGDMLTGEAGPYWSAVPGKPLRVRLMRLAAGKGELARHADTFKGIPMGFEVGQYVRIHYPLVTNTGVQFTSWHLDGSSHTAHLPAGSAWLLDLRKPHTAVNRGDTDRIHLVVDSLVTDEEERARLLRWCAEGVEA